MLLLLLLLLLLLVSLLLLLLPLPTAAAAAAAAAVAVAARTSDRGMVACLKKREHSHVRFARSCWRAHEKVLRSPERGVVHLEHKKITEDKLEACRGCLLYTSDAADE